MSLEVCLGAASPISREMHLTIPGETLPQVLVLRYRLYADFFVRAWQLRSTPDAAPSYRYLGDSSRTCPGAFDRRVDRVIDTAVDVTDLLAPASTTSAATPLLAA